MPKPAASEEQQGSGGKLRSAEDAFAADCLWTCNQLDPVVIDQYLKQVDTIDSRAHSRALNYLHACEYNPVHALTAGAYAHTTRKPPSEAL